MAARPRRLCFGHASVPLIIEPDPDDPGCATVMVDATVAGRPYRLVLDTGAARSQLEADDYTSGLTPSGEDSSSGAFGGRVTDTVVTITELAAGPLRVATLDVTRGERGLSGRLGMDVLGKHRCHFRLDAGVLGLAAPPGSSVEHELLMSRAATSTSRCTGVASAGMPAGTPARAPP